MIETFLIIAIVGFVCGSQLAPSQDFQSTLSSMGVFAIASLRLIPAASNLAQCIGSLRNSSYTLDVVYLDLKDIENEGWGKQKIYSSAMEPVKVPQPQKILNYSKSLKLTEISYQYPGSTNLL
jgi:hypothetical protein